MWFDSVPFDRLRAGTSADSGLGYREWVSRAWDARSPRWRRCLARPCPWVPTRGTPTVNGPIGELRQPQDGLTTNGKGGLRAGMPGGWGRKRAVREPPLRETGSPRTGVSWGSMVARKTGGFETAALRKKGRGWRDDGGEEGVSEESEGTQEGTAWVSWVLGGVVRHGPPGTPGRLTTNGGSGNPSGRPLEELARSSRNCCRCPERIRPRPVVQTRLVA